MNDFVRQMFMSRYGEPDGRNPYGSRGGYVTERRPRRDRGMSDYGHYPSDYGYDYARYDSRRGDYAYSDRRDERGRRDYEHGGQYYDNARFDVDIREPRYDYERMDYDRRDYGEMQYGKLSMRDMETWKREMENEDGSRGEHFTKEQVEQATRQIGFDINEVGKDVFCLAMNMMYSDYCNVAKKYGVDRPDYYADLAKAFLKDKDFDGRPEEKLWLYYKCIVEKGN